MGQRSFRGQLMDNITRDYLSNNETTQKNNNNTRVFYNSTASIYSNLSHTNAYEESTETKKEQLIDLDFEYDLTNPFSKVKDMEKIRKGIINYFMQGNKRIDKLNLTLKTGLINKEIYQNLNLHLLFGVFFIKDINSINITIKNKDNEVIDDREIMSNIIDYMVFKKKVDVVINNKFTYQIHPGSKELSVILSYCSLKSFKAGFKDDEIIYLRDFINHTHTSIKANFSTLQKYKLFINKSIAKEGNSIILPNIEVSNYNEEREGIISFFQFLVSKFKFVSIEIILLNSLDYKQSYETILTDLNQILREFEYVILNVKFKSLDVDLQQLPNNVHLMRKNLNIPVLEENTVITYCASLIQKFNLHNITLTQHIHSKVLNTSTRFLDNIIMYHYCYYNRKLAEKCYSIIFLFSSRKNKGLTKIGRKKPIITTILEFCLGSQFRKEFYIKGELDYSNEIVKNKKIVTF